MYLPTRVKSGSSRFTCVLYGGFFNSVGVRLRRGCNLYPSIYGTWTNGKTTGCGKGLCEWHSTEWPRIREQQAILEICEVPKTKTFGISALKSNGNVITDFKLISLPNLEIHFPQLPGTQFPKIKPLHISENGVFMLLDRIDVSNSSGPDNNNIIIIYNICIAPYNTIL